MKLVLETSKEAEKKMARDAARLQKIQDAKVRALLSPNLSVSIHSRTLASLLPAAFATHSSTIFFFLFHAWWSWVNFLVVQT